MVIELEAEDWRLAAELVIRYADMPLGAVDASLAVAERLGRAETAPIDRRHFSVVRPPPHRCLHRPPVLTPR
jgi:hypothetical protein